MSKLNTKQAAFAENKAAGLTNRAAAIAAGYAQKAAQQTATKLMQHPGIKAAIKAATKGAGSVDIKPANVPKMPRDKYTDPKQFLLDVMNLATLPVAMRADAAKQLLPYMHARMGETGKKEKAKDAARVIAGSRSKFSTKQPPQLTVVRNE